MTHHEHGLQSKVLDYVRDAHALETSSLMMLRSMLQNTHDPEMRAIIEHHVDETERHAALLSERLDSLGSRISTTQEGGALIGSLLKGVGDQVRGDKAARNARDAYVTEHVEIAAYELLQRLARRAGDEATAEVARRNLADEKAMAGKIAATWDKVVDLTIEEAGAGV